MTMLDADAAVISPTNAPVPFTRTPNSPVDDGGVPVPGIDIVPIFVNDPVFPPIRLTPIADAVAVLEIVPWLVSELLESTVTAAAFVPEVVTEPPVAMVMFPGVPPDAADVLSALVVAPVTVRSSAELGIANPAAMALDNSTWRNFKIVSPATPRGTARTPSQEMLNRT